MSTDLNPSPYGPTLVEFLDALEKSGLLQPARVLEVRDRAGRDDELRSPDALARQLVLEGDLTEFQAQRLLVGRYKGLVCGRYAILDLVGAGAMGRVFRARHCLMNRVVALKMVSTHPKAVSEPVARFFHEMKVVGLLDHPNVVRAYDADLHGDTPYIVMEYLDGEDLDKLLRRRGPLPPDEVTDLLLQAARGLAHAHEKGVIHRDIKLTNLFLDKSGVLKVLDLGLGAFVDESGLATGVVEAERGRVVGTADFMSPEQISGKPIDFRTDLFSLGCTAYLLLTGKYAFPGPDREVRLLKRLNDKHVPLAAVRPDLPYRLVQVVDRLLATDPRDRFASASEAADALEELGRPAGWRGRGAPAGGRGPKAAPSPVPDPSEPDDPILNASLIESGLRSNRRAAAAGPTPGPAGRPPAPPPPQGGTLGSHRGRLEADGEESGRGVHQEYRKELIQLNRAMIEERVKDKDQTAEPAGAVGSWLERLGERLGDSLAEPSLLGVLVVLLAVLLVLGGLLALALG
jgi:serine/threonine-protein kinase